MATKKNVQREEDFMKEVRSSLDEAERLMRDAAEATGDKATEMREAAMRSLRQTRETLHDTQAIGVAGIVGLLFGMLVSRK